MGVLINLDIITKFTVENREQPKPEKSCGKQELQYLERFLLAACPIQRSEMKTKDLQVK